MHVYGHAFACQRLLRKLLPARPWVLCPRRSPFRCLCSACICAWAPVSALCGAPSGMDWGQARRDMSHIICVWSFESNN
eukprot:350997-Chlamydomonas_euryale.AAC.2